MKKKILLLISLVLLTVQGWASPVDSLKTHLTRLDSIQQCHKFERLDSLIPFDGFVRPGFNPDDFIEIDDDHKTRNPVAVVFQILDLINQYQPFIYFDEIEDESESFVGVTVGTSATKKYRVYGDNVSGANILNRLLEILDAFNVVAGIKFDLLERNTDEVINVSDEIIVEPDYLRLSDFRNGKENIITITYSPTTERAHAFSCIGRYDLSFTNGLWNLVDYALLPVINMFGIEAASAVDRNIVTSERLLSFSDQTVGKSKTLPVHVTGKNLSGPLMVEFENNNGGMFSFDKDRITIDEAENDGTDVMVTYSPTSTGTHEATITIREEGSSETVKLDLSGNALERHITTSGTPSFPTLTVGESKTLSINISGTNLNGPLTVDLSSKTGMFHLDSDSYVVTPDQAEAEGGTDIYVTYSPTSAGVHGGMITISGGDAMEDPIILVFEAHCTPPAHIISVDPTLWNFGTVTLGDAPHSKSFNVTGTNLTNDLVLSLSPECPHYTVSPERITPDDAAEGKLVTVTYHPSATGTHNVTLKIDEEGMYQGGQLVNLSGKCVGIPTISVNKTSLDFGSIEVGQEKPLSINVTGTNLTSSITVTKEETHGGQFTISRETLNASGGSVIVTFKPTETGSFGGCVRFSSEGATPVSVSLTGNAQELSVYPTSLNFGTTYKNGTVTKKFTVYGGNLTGNVTLSSSDTTIFKVTPKTITPAEAKVGKEVTVTFKPTAGRSYSGEITVSASGVTPKKVSVSGKCAVISSNPTSYNFGNVAVGKPVTKVITITGTNLTGAMSITLAETEGGQYSINKTTLPASGGTVIVTFKPTDAKSFGASLNISGGSASAVSVSLTGKGVTPTITRNKSTLTFTGSSITSDYVKVTGTNLDDVISLTVTGSTNFTVSPSTISISDAADGKQVKVTCNPKNATSAEATLKISSPYASTKYVTLKYSRGSSGGGEVQVSAVQPEGGDEDTNNEFTNGGSLDVMNGFTTEVNELAMNSKVYAEGLNIIIESPVEQNAIISDISGRARSVNLQAGRNEIPVNASGIYIVRIREKTTKLMLK